MLPQDRPRNGYPGQVASLRAKEPLLDVHSPGCQHFVIETDDAPDEKIHFRGIAFTPKDGGRIVVRRRG